jgi:hypothetical protein
MSLQASLAAMWAQYKEFQAADLSHQHLSRTFDESFDDLPNAKDERDFDKRKKDVLKVGGRAESECSDALAFTDPWIEATVRCEEAIKLEEVKIEKKKKELQDQYATIEKINQQIEKYNNTPRGRINPKETLGTKGDPQTKKMLQELTNAVATAKGDAGYNKGAAIASKDQYIDHKKIWERSISEVKGMKFTPKEGKKK